MSISTKFEREWLDVVGVDSDVGFSRRVSTIAMVIVLGTAGCLGDVDDKGVDECPAEVSEEVYECFQGAGMPEGAVEEGEVEIGTGREQYEPVSSEQDLKLFAGFQGGFHFEIRTRIRGLDGGEPGVVDADRNPATVLSAYNEDGERLDSEDTCGTFLAYEPAEEYDVLPSIRLLPFGVTNRPEFGERVRIKAEVIDQCGRYASDDVWITAVE